MDSGYRSPLVDFFRRGEVARDVRLLAAQGALAPRAHEQLALLILLSADADALVARTAQGTLDALPAQALEAFLARADVPEPMREFFAGRGITPASAPALEAEAPLVETDAAPLPHDTPEDQADERAADDPQVLSSLSIVERMKLAMKGTRGQRASLIRDSNKLVAAAVLSSPKLTETEVEAFAKMANVSEDVLRIIANNRSWTKNYSILSALARNPKTPIGVSMQLVQRLNDRDVKSLSMDRNVPEAVRLVARKFVVKALK
ncbi:MAG: hypothetical protein H0X67_02545 [Acidobacteria bacterium]|nr:hypothetical protein [Acidobacteriota bacterium]